MLHLFPPQIICDSTFDTPSIRLGSRLHPSCRPINRMLFDMTHVFFIRVLALTQTRSAWAVAEQYSRESNFVMIMTND